jgi:F0F1-type ATP synthase delta subunit
MREIQTKSQINRLLLNQSLKKEKKKDGVSWKFQVKGSEVIIHNFIEVGIDRRWCIHIRNYHLPELVNFGVL